MVQQHKREHMAQLLGQLEVELKRLSLWQAKPPSRQALASTQPFCIDTLTLPQWLQFVFIPKMAELLGHNQPVPSNIGIAPLAEHLYQNDADDKQTLLELLRAIDEC